jgi:CRISPR-associated protein Cmx8
MSDKPQSLEQIVLDVVKTYLSRRLASKFSLEWKDVQGHPQREAEYEEKKEKLAKEAFLAVRARTGADFVEYFVSTLCSVPQRMTDATFAQLSHHLFQDTDRIRTLTLLALSARS